MVNLARRTEGALRLLRAVAIVAVTTAAARPEDGRLLDVLVTCTSGTLDDGARLCVEAALPGGVEFNADDLTCQGYASLGRTPTSRTTASSKRSRS
jgi:hypothetical protein